MDPPELAALRVGGRRYAAATLGFGDYRPVGVAGRRLATLETALGVTLLALLAFALGRRAAG